ncbi:GH32 C-terminal domain-containing protein [Micromonospora sp. NPDC048930]|uniref:glycoside hydrolase family 32 protein n=1 Tax=Micromonospora sp. NPDC048930 TaxID=3364261 RepID=UPI00370FDD30
MIEPTWMAAPVLVEVVFAPLSLTSLTGRPSGLVSWGDGRGGHLTLGYDRRGRPSVELAAAGQERALVADEPLTLAHWTRIALLATGSQIMLYVDGRCVASAPWQGALPVPVNGEWFIGCRADSPRQDGAPVDETACGLVRDVRVVTSVDTDEAVRQIEAAGGYAGEDLDVVAVLRSARRPDPNRPTYHFMPPAHWMNEPHGPIQIDGVHHLFYQANRRGAFWGAIEWGHATSPDLVHWTHLPPALTPDQVTVAPDGVWSGNSLLDESGQPLLFITAGDLSRTPNQAVAVARPAAAGAGPIRWIADNTTIVEMPSEIDEWKLVPGQFRDPFAWREQGSWFLLVGAGVVERGGTAVLYRSPDGVEWDLVGPLLIGDQLAHPETGEMWELPVLLPIRNGHGDHRHVLLVCPWWEERPAGRVVEVVYWIGRWEPQAATFTPDHPEPRRLDYGRHFTGPSGNVLDDGRTILWSIAQDGRPPEAQRRAAWAHNAGLPLELTLAASGDLAIRPVRELASLRAELLAESLDAEPRAAVPVLTGMALELELHARVPLDDEPLKVMLLDTAGQIRAAIDVDCARQTLSVSRPDAAAYDVWHPGTRDSGPVELPDGEVRLRLFVDHSMVEAYLNESRSITTRIDVTTGPSRLALTGGSRTRITSCRVWRLAPADTSSEATTPTER